MMKIKRIISIISMFAVLGTTTAFAGVESAVNDGNYVSVWGKSSTGASGERYSVVLHDNYNSQMPALSAKGAWQGVSKANGEWNINIPLADGVDYNDLSIQYGDNSGVSQVFAVSEYEETVKWSIDEVGHIFFGAENVKIMAEIDNKTLNNHEYDVYVRVYEEGKEELLSQEVYSVTALSETNQKYEVSIDMTKAKLSYGMFELEAAAVLEGETVTDEDFSDRIRFSVAKENTELNEKLGIHTQFGQGYADPEINTRLLKNAGFSGIRDYVGYPQCFANGVWSEPVRYNGWKDDVENNDLSQIILLLVGEFGYPDTPEKIEQFKQFAKALVENLIEDGVYQYEILNEQNWHVSAESYAELLINIVPAMRIDEKVEILACATAGVSNYHTANWIVDVMKAIQAKGLDPHDYIDYITVHPYMTRNQWPEKIKRTCTCTYGTESYEQGQSQYDTNDTIPGNSSLTARMDNLVNRLKEVGCEDIPFIATETGWFSYNDVLPDEECEKCIKNKTTAITELQQAQYMVRESALLHERLEKIYFHTLNNKTEDKGPQEQNYGFTENWKEAEIPYEAKPVFIAMANFNSLLSNAELIEENVTSGLFTGTKYDYVFLKDGKRIHMMWTTDNYALFNLTLKDKAIRIHDMYGNAGEKQYNTDGKYYISLSGSPVYVEEILTSPKLEISEKDGAYAAKVTLPDVAEEKGVVVCAVYSGDRLLEVTSKNLEIGQETVMTEYIENAGEGKVRAFYWNSLLSASPLVPMVEIIK